MLVPGFAFDSSIVNATARALIYLLKLELTEGWRCWRPKRGADGSIGLPDKDKPDEMKTPTSLQTAG